MKQTFITANATKAPQSIRNSYVQYGCGLSAPEDWLNFDASPNLLIERLPIISLFYAGKKFAADYSVRVKFPRTIQFGNIVKGLPLKNGSVKAIYASHVLEHLSLDDFRVALKNTFNMLESGGIFRLIVPDLKLLAGRYIKSSDTKASISFIEEIGMGSITRPRGLKGIIQTFFGNGKHLWMWDYKSLKLELENIGFTDIRIAYFNDSEDPMFKSVEDQERFVDAVAIQCKKPC
ncbi:MAG TPA: methyltransferase domain-containing protein [Nostoc sp.]|uniref:class I SAM-dependent methyltransferase n=1 Tax=Nostoc sp. TaxID=1180 RepID=UPI002D331455|nr:methyltransferase domain-containing protein [Nostoc sp.]HYX18495.1 methyltransferase domain-containing protein [Nostoc sp.]